MFNIVVNPKYEFLRSFVTALPNTFESTGHSIYKERNELKVYNVEGVQLNVKSFKVPIFINKVAYAHFRPTKARRAYEFALEVIKRGFDTPEPVAYIEEYKGSLLFRSYFICLQCPYKGIMRVFHDEDTSNDEKADLIEAFASYSAKLHEAEILHSDYSPGNIIFEKQADGYHFSLLDLNRMRFCKIDAETGCREFRRMRGNEDFFRRIGRIYAEIRGFDPKFCEDRMVYYRNDDRKKREQKWRIIK